MSEGTEKDSFWGMQSSHLKEIKMFYRFLIPIFYLFLSIYFQQEQIDPMIKKDSVLGMQFVYFEQIENFFLFLFTNVYLFPSFFFQPGHSLFFPIKKNTKFFLREKVCFFLHLTYRCSDKNVWNDLKLLGHT